MAGVFDDEQKRLKKRLTFLANNKLNTGVKNRGFQKEKKIINKSKLQVSKWQVYLNIISQ